MLSEGEAGIDCDDCGKSIVVTTKEGCDKLIDQLVWPKGHCDPECPECGGLVTFEHYI